jgi:DNA recombination protein RmuC
MEVFLVAGACVVLVIALVLVQTRGARSITARIQTLDQNLERIERSTRDEFATNRRESADALQRLGESLVNAQSALGDAETKQLQTFGSQIGDYTRSAAEEFAHLRTEVNQSIQSGATATANSVADLSRLSVQRLDTLSSSLTDRLTTLETRSGEELTAVRRDFQFAADNLRESVTTTLADATRTQTNAIETLRSGLDAKVESMRTTVEQRLRDIQQDNAAKLDQMRQTVDEKLQSTLETRLGESFRQVSDRLEQVYKGLGEMQVLASGVGDLKRVLTNVKARGTWGEVQLAALLEQVLSPEQYGSNVATGDGGERVEYAIKLPGRNGKEDEPAWLPIDAKFPLEDYHAVIDAAERADTQALDEAGRRLEVRVKASAKDIASKYINPPKTTDFAILFVPNEGLYAEILRRPGLVDCLQRQHRIVLAGPTSLWAILTSLQMGFKTLAIERRSSEVWAILGAVKTEFGKFGTVLDRVQKNLQTATNKIDEARRGTRAIERKLADVQELPSTDAVALLDAPVFELDPEPELVTR